MLWVTEQTVKFHLSNIYRKLSVSNRTEASRWARCTDCFRSSRPRARQRRSSSPPGFVLRNGARPPPDQSGAAARALEERPENLADMGARVYPPEGGSGPFPLGLREGPHPRARAVRGKAHDAPAERASAAANRRPCEATLLNPPVDDY